MRNVNALGNKPRRLNVLIVLFLFLGIFMPCIVKIRIQYIILVVEIVAIIWMALKHRYLFISSKTTVIMASFIPHIIYYTLAIIFNASSSGISFSTFLVEYTTYLSNILYVILTIILVQNWIKYKNYTANEFYRYIMAVASVQLVCVILAFVSPGIKTIFNNLTIRNSFSERYSSILQRQWYASYRAYGLAENLFDGFGYVISLLIIIIFINGIDSKNTKITLLSLIMLVMPLLNARTGVVLCLVSMVYVLFQYFNPKKVLKYVAGIVFVIVAVFILYNYLPSGLKIALSDGVEQTILLLRGGEKTGVYGEILSNDVALPQNILWGAGLSPERAAGFKGIDSGYIQCLWRYGVIGTILFLGAYMYIFIYTYLHSRSKKEKTLTISIMIIFYIYCFKLFFFSSYANNFVLFMILTVLTCSRSVHDVEME